MPGQKKCLNHTKLNKELESIFLDTNVMQHDLSNGTMVCKREGPRRNENNQVYAILLRYVELEW